MEEKMNVEVKICYESCVEHLNKGFYKDVFYEFDRMMEEIQGHHASERPSVVYLGEYLWLESRDSAVEMASEEYSSVLQLARRITRFYYVYLTEHTQLFTEHKGLLDQELHDYDFSNPFERYFCEGLLLDPTEHHRFKFVGGDLGTENLLECSYMQGVILQGLMCGSPEHLQDLMMVYHNDRYHKAIRARAYVGVLVSLLYWHDFLEIFPEVQKLIKRDLLGRGKEEALGLFYISYYRTLYGPTANKKLVDEVLPFMLDMVMKNKIPGMRLDNKNGVASISDRLLIETDDPKLKETMDFIRRMARENFDMHLFLFRDFIKNPPVEVYERYDPRSYNNWLLPYSEEHPSMKAHKEKKENTRKSLFPQWAGACDMDRYFFSLTGESITTGSGLFAAGQQQNLHFSDPSKEKEFDDSSINIYVDSFVKSLFRFFLYCKDWNVEERALFSPFSSECWVESYSSLLKDVESTYILRGLVAVMRSVERRDDAITLCYATEHSWMDTDADLNYVTYRLLREYREKGASEITNDDMYVYLERAVDIDPSHEDWNLDVVDFYEIAHHEEAGFRFLHDWEVREPKNLKLVVRAVRFYVIYKHYDDAFKSLFRGLFYHPKNVYIIRYIAWLSLLAGKAEQAEKYYKKLYNENAAMPKDLFHLGHALLILGRESEAVSWFVDATEREMATEDFQKIPAHEREERLWEILESIRLGYGYVESYGITQDKLSRLVEEVFRRVR